MVNRKCGHYELAKAELCCLRGCFEEFALAQESSASSLTVSGDAMPQYKEIKVQGYGEFMKTVENLKQDNVFVLFSGNKTEAGVSWCPDCVTAEPIIIGELEHLPEGSIFIYCQVGERAYWKDSNNDFKKCLKLTSVPTLLKYRTPQKLSEDDCMKANLVRMLFTEE